MAEGPEALDIRKLRGLVATVVLTGYVDDLYAAHHEEMRAYNIQHDLNAVEYKKFAATLVEAGRDQAVMHALTNQYDYILQIDADAAPFPPNALERLLQTAFIELPDADAIGGYCQLKGSPFLPTIDTGTGTWEEIYPGQGVIPAIRTGAHFLLVKTSAFSRFGPPWFRTRYAKRPIDALAEVDNFARCNLHGSNPFTATPEWNRLVDIAKRNSGPASSVGEDSGFCDALYAAGGKLYIDTGLVVGHVAKDVILPHKMRDAMRERKKMIRSACGLTQ